ncbi:MAG: M23 family metallopeptidase [Clostridia bacterium]|nr:M23 family metallopeptidase [Clostridia bacterium]
MERVLSPEERIRRAEEIYNRRRTENRVRVSTSRVNVKKETKLTLYKKLILQILICFVLYFIFYLIKNSNYIFSENFINKTREFLSYDINFGNAYNSVVEYYNNHIKSFFIVEDKKENEEQNTITNEVQENTQTTNEIQEGGIGGGEDELLQESENKVQETSNEPVVQLSQMELDAKEIKEKYSMILPLTGYTTTSRYGPRTPTDIVSANHKGIDIGANEGTVFIAAMSGTVTIASGEGSYGNHIFIENGDVITVYAHCKTLYVKPGDKVEQGQKIGEVGSTGNATGPHLHFEIRKSGRTVDPEYILQFA